MCIVRYQQTAPFPIRNKLEYVWRHLWNCKSSKRVIKLSGQDVPIGNIIGVCVSGGTILCPAVAETSPSSKRNSVNKSLWYHVQRAVPALAVRSQLIPVLNKKFCKDPGNCGISVKAFCYFRSFGSDISYDTAYNEIWYSSRKCWNMCEVIYRIVITWMRSRCTDWNHCRFMCIVRYRPCGDTARPVPAKQWRHHVGVRPDALGSWRRLLHRDRPHKPPTDRIWNPKRPIARLYISIILAHQKQLSTFYYRHNMIEIYKTSMRNIW